ncbi:MAG: cyclomaltodextrinase N-terminal domain-containing protein, partial [Muribaculaceae bacterium]|nr:cyclomaltodextrinase N-terminal domain-containing protein [Muribaculaceae bacterium]
MKRLLSISLGILSGMTAAFGARGPEVTNVEPPYWWTGMRNDTLQVMLTGPGIASATASVDYEGVRLAEQVNLDSPNYKLLYFVIGRDTHPGTMDIILTDGKRKAKVAYELKERDKNMAAHGGFDARDVLYLLMPDRFAKGADLKGDGLNHNPAVD